jgi:hypothetical protein
MPATGKVTVKKSRNAPEPDQRADPRVLIKGYGSLKGKLALPDDIDWTKPIYSQVLARERRRADRASEKRRLGSKKSQPGVAA